MREAAPQTEQHKASFKPVSDEPKGPQRSNADQTCRQRTSLF